ncbi:PREDICTED: uncharacterized protein LOC108966879 [Bactrocera latifrons]|uniref:CUB domain-containing protein n=1 Tax=Bactrocera latifrons TaxID=174628 RepID=A0A0K8V036_BACLA|nr:PREDICTED: uncharacterized protein LOC108966879 [Bactrocera latifrons]
MTFVSVIAGVITLGIIGYVMCKDINEYPRELSFQNSLETPIDTLMSTNEILQNHSHSRSPRWFPFYTIGRFPNDVCVGANQLAGTCVVRGECSDNGGVAAGTCSTITTQAVCCIYQLGCGSSTSYNNTYFYNSGYPGTYAGGGRCTIVVSKCDSNICQLRIDFLSLSIAPPNGDGFCVTDTLTITGGSRVPTICGENNGQHVYVDFNGDSPITISVATSDSYTFNRQWQFQIAQLACASATQAPSGCLQYYMDSSGTVSSFNYDSAANSLANSIGVAGTRQIANQQYGICVRMGAGICSITWSQVSSDAYSFTLTNDVGVIDPSLLATLTVQSQNCTTDFIIIPNPTQNGAALPSDRFCGLGLVSTTSATKPFVLYSVTDGNEDLDMSNRGFHLLYSQNSCPVV